MSTLQKLIPYMGSRRILLPVATALSALSAAMGMLPYLFIWLIAKQLLAPGGIPTAATASVNTYAWWAMGTAAGSIIVYFIALAASHLAAFRVESNLRRQAMARVLQKPLGFFDVHPSGRIRKVIDENASITHTFLAHQLPDLAGTLLVPLVALGFILWFDWQLGLACILPLIGAVALMSYMMGHSGKEFLQKYMASLEEMNTEAVEYVRGIPVVKVFQQTIYTFKRFHRSILAYNKMVQAYTRLWEVPMSLYTVVVNGFVFFLVPTAILLIGHAGSNYTEVLLDLLLFVLITPVFSESIMRSMYLSQSANEAGEALKRLDLLLDYEPLSAPAQPKRLNGDFSISFEHVSFSYPGTSQKAIDDISFTLPQGKTYALVGPSGSGKTTIARLIPRFWEAGAGHVRIGSTDVREIDPGELMQHISFVFQHTHLFKTTLLENIKYGNPDATEAQVQQAIDRTQCREIIDKLPQGLNTRIGADGTYLSGGEQQRIALARAMLKNAPIILLDEATAFADPENEYQIRCALKELTGGEKTVLLIAHRLSTVVDADQILVINQGKIAEQGTHQSLLKQNGLYARMWTEYQHSTDWTINKQ